MVYSNYGSEVVYLVMVMMEYNGNYICKVEVSRIFKVISIMVNIIGRFVVGGCWYMVGLRNICVGI